MSDVRRVSIDNDLDIVAARAEGKMLAQGMEVDISDQLRIANVGLAGTKRLLDDVAIESRDGLGTTVKVRRWLS